MTTEAPDVIDLPKVRRGLWDRYGVVIVLVAGALVAVALAYVIGSEAEADPGTIKFEFYKLLVQAVLIVAVGACLSAAIAEDRRRREVKERLRELSLDRVESILRDVDEDYRLIKRSRRMLRLESPIRHSLYRTEMTNLEDIQRSLEEVHTDAENLKPLTGSDFAEVIKSVDSMKDYLDDLWKEYERQASRTNEELVPTSVEKLRGFLAPFDEGTFRCLKESHQRARSDLMAQMARLAAGIPQRTH